MWARFEGDRNFHLVPGLRARTYLCGLRVRAHVATADAKPSFAPVCAVCEQGRPLVADRAPEEPPAPKRRLIAPGSESERVYYQFVMEQIEFEQDAVEQELAHLKGRGRDSDFVSGSIRSWQLKDRRDRRGVLESLLARPYFGRIDFLEGGAERADVVYVGCGSLMEADHIFVHDWRADICSLYYRHAVGPARFACPAGHLTGEVRLHRTFTIANGQFQGYQDLGGEGEGGSAADDILVGLLSQHTTGKMRQIVQSIQAEQDNIIRNRADIVAVQGPAGSGKTIIALHRAAYLLYQQRIARPPGSVSSRGMLAFSPNRAFSSYIASVLPDLNEGQIRQIILHQFLSHHLARSLRSAQALRAPTNRERGAASADSGLGGRQTQGRAAFRVESAAEQFETALDLLGSERFQARRRICAFKSSRALLELVEDFAAKQELDAEDLLAGIAYPSDAPGQAACFSRDEMLAVFRRSAAGRGSLAERLRSVLKATAERVNDTVKHATIGPSTAAALRAQMNRFERSLAPLLSMNPCDAYAALWRDAPSLQATAPLGLSTAEIAAETLGRLEQRVIPAEDIVPILLLDGCLNGFPRLEGVEHAIIDEAQDYSLATFEYLRHCLPETCKLTIVGDLRQATNPLLSLGDYAGLDTVFTRGVEYVHLTTSYRSSLEIGEFTAAIVPGDAGIESVRRTSMKPVLVSVGDPGGSARAIAAILARKRASPAGSTAIICKTSAESEALHAALDPLARVTLVTDNTRDMPPGVYVLPIWLAKGLEFDTVILHDAGIASYRHEEERRILYTGCSRALHELYVCYSGPASPLLPLDREDLYTRVRAADLAATPAEGLAAAPQPTAAPL